MASVDISSVLKQKEEIPVQEKISIVWKMSMPSILAQISEIVMQYIDAAMVGVLGAAASASIGLVSTSTWLVGGVMMAVANGFAVQVAHAAGAEKTNRARQIYQQSLFPTLLFSIVLGAIAAVIGFYLPVWLGAEASLHHDATMYFVAFSLFLPVRMVCNLCLAMLRCSGNMKTPSILSTLMCLLDVIFNYFLIFPATTISILGFDVWIPRAGLGVLGAQLGTSFAVLVCMVLALRACQKSKFLKLEKQNGILPKKEILQEAFHIGAPMGLEQIALSLAQVISTRIVAPLGTIAIAANSFAVTAESLCYMPGYGISAAATTIVGQSFGAKRKDLASSFAWLSVLTGMAIMTACAIVMFFVSPYIFAFLTPVKEVQDLGVEVLRIELFAEPLFAASIVSSGALRGAGDTLVPAIMNLICMWGVRLTLAYALCATLGLVGVWIAMSVELCVRGLVLLYRLKRGKWLERIS